MKLTRFTAMEIVNIFLLVIFTKIVSLHFGRKGFNHTPTGKIK